MTALGLCCSAGVSPAAESGAYSLAAAHGCLVVVSLVELRLEGARASVVMAPGLSCSAACGHFPDQRSNSFLLHWQADSLLLSHQGSPMANNLARKKWLRR